LDRIAPDRLPIFFFRNISELGENMPSEGDEGTTPSGFGATGISIVSDSMHKSFMLLMDK